MPVMFTMLTMLWYVSSSCVPNCSGCFICNTSAPAGNLPPPVIRAPQEDGWAPGYYSLLFEDPDGVRLEINHVPGKGVFDTDERQVKLVEPKKPAT